MRNIFKLASLFVIMLLVIISSCKKEEEIIEGCSDSAAMNFQSAATSNDGSCIYAYDIAQGEWVIETACEELTISIPLVGDFPIPLNDMFPDTVEITGEDEGVVAMDINGSIILADVANNGEVTIQEGQTISLDTGVIGEVDVTITGSGLIESATSGDLTLYLEFEIPLAGTQASSCEITFIR